MRHDTLRAAQLSQHQAHLWGLFGELQYKWLHGAGLLNLGSDWRLDALLRPVPWQVTCETAA